MEYEKCYFVGECMNKLWMVHYECECGLFGVCGCKRERSVAYEAYKQLYYDCYFMCHCTNCLVRKQFFHLNYIMGIIKNNITS